MASTQEYKEFILAQINLDNITCRPMMGEYLLYYNGILFGGIYDDRLLIKKVENNKKYNMQESIPYKNAKPMYLVSDVDNMDVLKNVILDTYKKWIEKIKADYKNRFLQVFNMQIVNQMKTLKVYRN